MTNGRVGIGDRLMVAVEEAVLDVWHRRRVVAAAVAAIGVALTFPALLTVGLSWSHARVVQLAESDRLRVYLAEGAPPGSVARVRDVLASVPGVDAIEHVGADVARARFRERFPELASLPDELSADELSLPSSLEARVAGGATAAAARRAIIGLPGVEEVRHDVEWSRALAGARRSLDGARLAVVLLALVITAFGIANVVRVDALSRREELAIQRLVGAPGLHLRAPFILAGALQGGLGGLVAWMLLAVVASVLATPLAPLLPAARAGLPAGTIPILVVGSALAGAAGAAWGVGGVLRRHARLER